MPTNTRALTESDQVEAYLDRPMPIVASYGGARSLWLSKVRLQEDWIPDGTVDDIATGCILTVGRTESLRHAIELISENRVSRLVVMNDSNELIGVVSKRDFARFLMSDQTSRNLEAIQVSEASGSPIQFVRRDSTIADAARLFREDNRNCAIVLDDGSADAIVTETDFCEYYSRHCPDYKKVGDFMTREFITSKSSYPILHVAHQILFQQPSVPVIDNELVGILTLSNLLSILSRKRNPSESLASAKENEVGLVQAKEIMTSDPITCGEDADLVEAARTLIAEGINSLPVLDRSSLVIGLLNKHDILKALQ